MIALVFATALIAAPTTFTLTSGEVDFEISAPLDTIKGVSRAVSGSLTLDPDNWADKPQAKIDIDLDSFKTGIDLRDEDLRDQFFETTKHKKATLTVTALERPSTTKLEKGVTAEAFARATLSLHGVDKELLFPVKVVFDDDMSRSSVGISAAFVVPLEEFAMKRPQRLVFKLGKDVRVVVRGRLRGPPPSTTTTPPATETLTASLPALPPVVARTPPKTEKPPAPTWAYPPTTPEGKGERAFKDPGIGGSGNVMTCGSCHGVHDERLGLADPKTKSVPPSSSLWGVAHRTSWWRGVARSPENAASICARMFMLRNDNLSKDVEASIAAYFEKLSRDPLPAHDYSGVLMAKAVEPKKALAILPTGDARRGALVVQRTCARCHGVGHVRPALTPGLYSKEQLVGRVRGTAADARQMPSYAPERLTDSELADVIALLADDKQRIFQRR